MRIETERLILIPMDYDFIVSKLERRESLLEKNGVKINEEYFYSSDIIDILPMMKEEVSKNGVDGFGPWLIILKDTNRIIGSCGCHGEPDGNKEVEIGYGIDADSRRKGYASEAIKAFIAWLIENKDLNAILADCNLDNAASAGVLENNNMIETKRDDKLIYWKLEVKED